MNCKQCVNYDYVDGHEFCKVGGTMVEDEKCHSFESKVDENKINHPSHYLEDGGMECIDEMVLLFGVEETKSFCKLNAWKYRKRSPFKNGDEDRAKANWYIAKFKELSDKEDESFTDY